VASPAFLDPGWLPPEGECPELADLRQEHTRLLKACADALDQVAEARQDLEQAKLARQSILRKAIASGERPEQIKPVRVQTSKLHEATQMFEAASDVLEEFVANAQKQIRERAPQIHASLAEHFVKADEKRKEAGRLLAEADRLEAAPKRMTNWLDRYTGQNVLGPIAFESMGMPMREPVPQMFREIANLPPQPVTLSQDYVEHAANPDIEDVGDDAITPEEMEAMKHAGRK
jgi:hypothetical protein